MTLTAAQTREALIDKGRRALNALPPDMLTAQTALGAEAVLVAAGIIPERDRAITLTAAQTALRTAESHVQQRRQELQAAVLQARETRSLADIARELGVSKQRVQQISEGK